MKRQTLLNKINYTLSFLIYKFTAKEFALLDLIRIADSQVTVNEIIRSKASISRFGDGELRILSGSDTDFQKANPKIVSKLKKIISQPSPGLLVGLPHVWKRLWPLKYRAFEYWSAYLRSHLSDQILPYVNTSIQYYDASFTRFFIDYRTKKNATKLIPLIKEIWQDRDVCFIEGKFSRLGVGNDLFSNAKSIKRIICPPTNAFEQYDNIIKEANKLPKSTLVLLALGMTATCLAYDLHISGYQAVDIGHVDVEYDWYRLSAKDKIPLNNKYVAESNSPRPNDEMVDAIYNSQIIAKIGV